MQPQFAQVVGHDGLIDVDEGPAGSRLALHHLGQVVDADDHVLAGGHDGPPVRRGQDVVGGQHQHPGLGLRLGRQGHVHGHLVAVEVGVEGLAHQRVDLDGLALDQHRLEGLDAEAVQGGGPVQQHGVLLDDLLEHVPHLGALPLHHALGRLDVLGHVLVDQPLHDEGLEQLQRHGLGQAALVQAQLGPDHDDRAARVVDALAQQVLAEAALLALEHVGERLQRAAARAGDGAAAPPVVEQGVHRLLQHPLLVVDDDLGGAEVEQPLQAVVAVDDAAVQVVEVAGGEAAAVELHHGAQVGRDHRDGLEDHGPRVVGALGEGGEHLEALGGPLPPLRRVGLEVLLELDDLGVEVEPAEQVLDRLGAHAAGEVLLVAVAHLAPQLLGLDQLLDLQGAEGVEGLDDELLLVVGPLLAVAHLALRLAAGRRQLLALGPALLHLRQLGLEALEAGGVPLVELAPHQADLGLHGLLELGQRLVALVLIHEGDEVGREVDDLLQVLRGHVEQVAQAAGDALEVPDVGDRSGQFDVAHPLAPHLGARHLDAAALADDAAEADALVLAAVALPVARRPEDALVEQAVLLRLQRAVVDGFRLLDLAVRPGPDLVGGGQADPQLIELGQRELLRSSASLVCKPFSRPAPGGRCRCPATRRCGTCPRPVRATPPLRRRTASPRSGTGSASP